MPEENLHANHRERTRQRFINEGLDSFAPHQVVEFLLFYAVPRGDTNGLAHKLLNAFGSISRLFEADPRDIAKRCNVKESTAIIFSMMPQVFRVYSKDAMKTRKALGDSAAAGEYAQCLFTGRIYEAFFVICLDKQNRIIHEEMICEGTIDEVPCYPRLVMTSVLRHNAQKVIFAHNHPSGLRTPSGNDIESTNKLVKVLKEVNIDVVDHIIVGQEGYVSMADIGCIHR